MWTSKPQLLHKILKTSFIYNCNINRNGRNLRYGKHVSKHAYIIPYINYSHDEGKSCSTFEIYVVCETCAHFLSFKCVYQMNTNGSIYWLTLSENIKHIYQCFQTYVYPTVKLIMQKLWFFVVVKM